MSEAVQIHRRRDPPARSTRRRSRDWVAAAALVRVEVAATVAGIEIVESVAAARRPAAAPGARADAVRDRHARALPAAAGASSPQRRGRRSTAMRSPQTRRLDGVRRARRARAGARAGAADGRRRRDRDGATAGSASTAPSGAAERHRRTRPPAPIGVEQSNSSIVFDDRLVLKVFRKLEPGINPELEMLRFLTAHDFPNIAAAARAGTSTTARRSRDARRRPGVPARRASTAGSWRSTGSWPSPERLLDRLGEPRRGDRAAAHRARLRRRRSGASRPRSRARRRCRC